MKEGSVTYSLLRSPTDQAVVIDDQTQRVRYSRPRCRAARIAVSRAFTTCTRDQDLNAHLATGSGLFEGERWCVEL